MKTNNKGFTLIEVICSVALLAIIITASSSFFTGVARSQKGSKQLLYANNLAQEIIEKATQSGDTSSLTLSKDGYKYYVEISAVEHSGISSSGSSDDSSDSDDSSSSSPSSTPYKLTYIPSPPPEGTTKPAVSAVPGEDAEPTAIPGEPTKYNLKIDLFDFIDEDLPMLIAAGNVLKSYSPIPSDGLTVAQIRTILSSSSEFSPYLNAYSAGSSGVDNLTKASVCYRGITNSVIAEALEQFISYNDTAMKKFTDRISDGTLFHNSIHNGSCPSPSTCKYTELSNQMYDYFMNNSEGNVYRMVQRWHDAYVQVSANYGENDVISMVGTDAIMFNGLQRIMVDRMSNNGLIHIYNSMNMAETNSGTKTGPYLFSKLYDNNGEFVSLDFAGPTKLVDDASTVRFQVYPRSFNLYTFASKPTWSWSESTAKEDIPLNTDVIDLPNQIAYYTWDTGKPVFGYQNNIVNTLSFYVVGGLSYRDMTLTSDFYGGGYADHFYTEDGVKQSYGPSIYYFESIDYGNVYYHFRVYNPEGYANLCTSPPLTPEGYEEPKSKGSTPRPGSEGSTGTDTKGVSRETIETYLSFASSDTNFYTVTVHENDKNGKVLAVLTAYGIAAQDTTPEDVD